MNQGVHTVDLLLWLMGDVVSVQAQMATALHKIEAEDTITALLEFANGAIGTLVAATSAYPGYPRRIEITGSEGTVILEHDKIIRADLKTPRPDLLEENNESRDQNQSATSATVSDVRGHQAHNRRFPPRNKNKFASAVRWDRSTPQRRADRSNLRSRAKRRTNFRHLRFSGWRYETFQAGVRIKLISRSFG